MNPLWTPEAGVGEKGAVIVISLQLTSNVYWVYGRERLKPSHGGRTNHANQDQHRFTGGRVELRFRHTDLSPDPDPIPDN